MIESLETKRQMEHSVCFFLWDYRYYAILMMDRGRESMKSVLNKNITIVEEGRKKHSKASEAYIHVKFDYSGESWDGWVPVEYRRTGVF